MSPVRGRQPDNSHVKRQKMRESLSPDSQSRSLSPDSRDMYLPSTLASLEKFLSDYQNGIQSRFTGLDLVLLREKVEDQHLQSIIEKFPNIKRLCISGCSGLSRDALKGLTTLTKLEKLDISSTTTSLETVKELAKLQSLQEFHLSDVAVNNELAKTILEMKDLKALDISGNKKSPTLKL